jgi:ribosomal protein S18 acetylase RimI-like enzyme
MLEHISTQPMSDFQIRLYHPSDLPTLYRICLLTGDSGQDASRLYQDPDLLGHLYVAPYAVLEPELCFVLTHVGHPCGYVLGTKNSKIFWQRCEAEWFPVLRQRYPYPPDEDTSRDAKVIRGLYRNRQADSRPDYPAHLHIDLLPVAQGKGWGRKMMTIFLDKLRELNIPGVELGVGKRNTKAIGFYEAMGFVRLEESERSYDYGLKLQ